MIVQTLNANPKSNSLSHSPSPNCALSNLAGFADKTVFVDSAQSQTRDGFSFDVLGKSVLQSAYSANVPVQKYRDGHVRHPETPDRHPATQERHPELGSGSAPNNRNAAGTEIGTRYRYIDDTPLVPMTEVGKANGSNAASSASSAKTRSRPNNEYVLYSYGEPVGMTNDSGTSYFGTDILGSVRNVTDKYGTVQADYSYDAFGSPYLGNIDNGMSFGYTGKAYDAGTGLYDYGFRDYSPVSARFTTVDPIRDGSNWFSYVVNDPVNYVDPFGLTASDSRTVRSGDTLSGMTAQFNKENGTNYTWQQIGEYNNLANPNLIIPGQTINFPGRSTTTTTTATTATQTGASPGSAQSQSNVQIVSGSNQISGVGVGGIGTTAQPASVPLVQNSASNNANKDSMSADNTNENINIFKEIFDIFQLEFKAGLGFDISFINKHLVQIDLGSLKGYISTKDDPTETYMSMGIGLGTIAVSGETTTVPAVKDIFNPENITISLFGFEINQDELDYKFSVGGQCVIGAYLNISGKEISDLFLKVGELDYEARKNRR